MLTTFDRYLLKRFFHAFGILFVGALGVFFVFDAFTNADEFQKASPDGAAWPVVQRMVTYYSCQSCLFLITVGHVLCVLAVMVVLVAVQRSGELHPLLAAGVPLYRLVLPLVLGTVAVNLLMVANQELLIPRIAHLLQAPRSRSVEEGVNVRASLDFATHILITAKRVYPDGGQLAEAEFVLPVPDVVSRLTTLSARRARYVSRGPGGCSGWLLAELSHPAEQLPLTDAGRKIVHVFRGRDALFVASGVTPDQLADKAGTSRFLSTPDLLRRVRNPSQPYRSAQEQVLALHARLTRGVLNICAVLLAVPFLVRREGTGVAANVAVGAVVLLGLLGFSEACLYLASLHLLAPDIAAWSPILVCGTCATWSARRAET